MASKRSATMPPWRKRLLGLGFERSEQQQKQYDDQQKMIAETKEFIERFKGTYSKTLQVQSRVKMLEKLELVEVDEVDTSALKLRFPPAPRSGNYPVIAEDVNKSYDEKLIFNNVKIGYFAQNQASLLDEELTVFQTIDDIAVRDIRTKIRNILGNIYVRTRRYRQKSESPTGSW